MEEECTEEEDTLNGEPKEESGESLEEKEVSEDADGPSLPLGLTGKLLTHPTSLFCFFFSEILYIKMFRWYWVFSFLKRTLSQLAVSLIVCGLTLGSKFHWTQWDLLDWALGLWILISVHLGDQVILALAPGCSTNPWSAVARLDGAVQLTLCLQPQHSHWLEWKVGWAGGMSLYGASSQAVYDCT